MVSPEGRLALLHLREAGRMIGFIAGFVAAYALSGVALYGIIVLSLIGTRFDGPVTGILLTVVWPVTMAAILARDLVRAIRGQG